ncbi:MAG TPA: serine/threonine-protein kinase [Gemmataceae bacterium]|jgi:serine/threonine protein kinase
MAVDSVSKFTAILQRYHLLEPAQHAEAVGPLAQAFPNPKNLAGELIRRGWLTPYQVNQIFQGRASDLLLESYVLLERLGEGGMGQVFKARNWKLNRPVALKIIRKERLNNPEIVHRFQREVRASARLNHPNVVHAFDCGECDQRHFYVMEYVDGLDLAKHVRRNGPLPIEQACDCIRQAALGLQHAYERGLVHRDIKPHNLLLAKGSDGQPLIKILDMGLARLDRGEDSMNSGTMTHEGAVMGTLDYIAPEQARNAHLADTRADLYSLGCTLYYLLTGQPVFPSGTPTEKLLKHQFQPPPSVHAHRTDVPASLAAVLQRLLAKQPEQRFQTPAETAAAMSAILNRAAVPVGQIAAGVAPVDAPLSDDGMFLPPAAPGEEMADTVAGWSEIIEAPPIGSSSSYRRRRADQRQHLVMWSVIGSLTLLALITLLLILL